MFEAIASQFMQSGAGAEILKQLQGQGVSPEQASSAVSATAEGAAQQLGGQGGLAGLAGMLTGTASPSVAGMIGPVAQFVAQKTGLSPAIAQTVVGVVLPKIIELVKGGAAGAVSSQAGAPGGIGSMLGGLLK